MASASVLRGLAVDAGDGESPQPCISGRVAVDARAAMASRRFMIGDTLPILHLASVRLGQEHIKERLGRRDRLAMGVCRADQFRDDVRMGRRKIESLARVR